MARRELTILVLGRPGRAAEAVGRAVDSFRKDGVECELVEALGAAAGGPAVSRLVQRCADALDGECEPVLVRLRLSAEDAALMDALAAQAREDLLVDPVPAEPTPAPAERPAERPTYESWRCPCGGLGCVQCLGEACP